MWLHSSRPSLSIRQKQPRQYYPTKHIKNLGMIVTLTILLQAHACLNMGDNYGSIVVVHAFSVAATTSTRNNNIINNHSDSHTKTSRKSSRLLVSNTSFLTRMKNNNNNYEDSDSYSCNSGTAGATSSKCTATRRQTLESVAALWTTVTITTLTQQPQTCHASNLPESTGTINLSKVGTIETLVPIVQLKHFLEQYDLQLTNMQQGEKYKASATATTAEVVSFPQFLSQFDNVVMNDGKNKKKQQLQQESSSSISTIPSPLPVHNEIVVKQLFDAYSIPPSYKQKFLNSNAFLVYYTQGYDGPNRSSIETLSTLEELQLQQYGYRNEVWIAYDEMMSEIDYARKNVNTDDDVKELVQNIKHPLHRTIQAIESYLDLAPAQDVQHAKNQL